MSENAKQTPFPRRLVDAWGAFLAVLRGQSVLINCDLVAVTPVYPSGDAKRLRLVGA